MLLDGGWLKCWGNDADAEESEQFSVTGADLLPGGKEVSFEDSEPLFVNGLSMISMWWTYACMVVHGDVYCWGASDWGLGTGEAWLEFDVARERAESGQFAVEIGERIVEVGVGGGHSCARSESGAVYCWGATSVTGHVNPDLGEVVGDDETPQDAGPLPLSGAAQLLSIEGDHTCVVIETGAVLCWSDGVSVQEAVEVRAPSPFVKVAAGGFCKCAVTTDADLYCWGTNVSGCLGTGNSDVVPPSAPAHIELDEPIAEVLISLSTTCVRSQTRKVKCWGAQGSHGQQIAEDLGDDETAYELPWLELGF